MRWVAALVMCVVIASTGCSTGPPGQELANTRSSNGPGEPRIEIVSPEPGDTVSGGEVEIQTRVSDFKLVDKVGKKNKKGEGHITFYRLESPDAEVPTQKNLVAHQGGEGVFTSYSGADEVYVWPDTPGKFVPPGTYTFVVQLVNNNRTPLDPPQVASVRIDVRE